MSYRYAGPGGFEPGWSVKAPPKKEEPNFSPADGSAPVYVAPPKTPNFSPADGSKPVYVPPPSGGRRRRSTPAPMTPAPEPAPAPVVPVDPPKPAPEPERSFRAPRQYEVDFPVYGPPAPPQRPMGEVRGVEPKRGLDRAAQNLRIAAQQRGDNLQGNVVGFASGFVQAGSDTLRFGSRLIKDTATAPFGIITLKKDNVVQQTAESLWTLATDREVRQSASSRLGYRLQTEPGTVFGGIGFDVATYGAGAAFNKISKARAAARNPTPAPTQNAIGRGVSTGLDTTTDFDFVNPAGKRVTGFQATGRDGTVLTELRVSDRTFVVRDANPTPLFSFDDAGRVRSEVLFDRSTQTFNVRGRLLSSSDELASAPRPVTVADTKVNREILSVVESPVDRRSGAFATSTAQTRFTSEADGLFVRGASATRQDTLTLANWRETAARLERGGFEVVYPPKAEAPQFTFKNVAQPRDKFVLARDGDTRFAAFTAESRAFTEGRVSTRGSFEVFTQAPPKPRSRPFDFGGLADPAPPATVLTPPVASQPSKGALVASGPGGLGSPTVIPRSARSTPPPVVQIRDLPEFRSAVDATPQVRGFQGLAPSSVPTYPTRQVATLTLVPVTDQPASESVILGGGVAPQTRTVGLLSPSVERRVNVESVQTPTRDVTPFQAVELESAPDLFTGGRSRSRTGGGQRPRQPVPAIQTPSPQIRQPDVLRPRAPVFRAPIRTGAPAPPVPFVLTPTTPRFAGRSPFAPGYRVFVRRGGEFKPTGPVLSRSEALEFGAFQVDSSPAASFKIKPAGAPTGSFGGKGFFGFFSPSKRESGVFVEPAKRRIRTPGEKRGITFKGIQAKRLTTRKVFK